MPLTPLAPIDLTEAPGRPSGNGVVRALDGGDDLNANLVHLDAGGEVASHRNNEVDVLVVLLAGQAQVEVGEATFDLTAPTSLLIPRGTQRAIRGGAGGASYLTVHRRRGGLSIGSRRPGGG